jgi:phosphoglycerol transferase MdoB-like AlkP superfamily enzyme
MIIYAPSLFKHAIRKEIGSQLDIIPTIVDVLNIENSYSSLGKSLFSKSKNRFVFLSYEGEQVFLINNDGTILKNWKDDSDSEIDDSKENAKLLYAIEKIVHDLAVSDRWFDQKRR